MLNWHGFSVIIFKMLLYICMLSLLLANSCDCSSDGAVDVDIYVLPQVILFQIVKTLWALIYTVMRGAAGLRYVMGGWHHCCKQLFPTKSLVS